MKQVQWLGIAAFAAVLASCNGNGTNSGTADTTATATTTTTTETVNSNGNYAAMADSFRVNSEAGNILDARTGKPIRVRYDVTSHRAVNEETNQPVWRYVDRRNWWVYGSDNDNWTRVGDARMEGSTLKYKSSTDDTWLNYDERWAQDDQRYMSEMNSGDTSTGTTTTGSDMSTGSNGDVKVKDNGNKVKDEDVKVKTSKDGDIKIKDKETGEKAKYNADNGKVKSGH